MNDNYTYLNPEGMTFLDVRMTVNLLTWHVKMMVSLHIYPNLEKHMSQFGKSGHFTN